MLIRPEEIDKGIRHLRRIDAVLRPVIRKAGPFRIRRECGHFEMLAHSILSQQISGHVARVLQRRLIETTGGSLTAEALRGLDAAMLRSIGISRQKAAYLHDLADHVLDGRLRLRSIGRLPNEAVIEHLTSVKGIGVWTAQMFLIFSLGRLDVFPERDLGVRNAIRKLYGLDSMPDREFSLRIASRWQPYATIASWYCWRSLDMEK